MRRLMGNHIARQTRIDKGLIPTRKIAEGETLEGSAVVGICLGEGVGRDLQLVSRRERPGYPPAESRLEFPECRHDDRIDVLGMKVRVADKTVDVLNTNEFVFGGIPSTGRPIAISSGIEIDDVHPMSLRSRSKALRRQPHLRR